MPNWERMRQQLAAPGNALPWDKLDVKEHLQ
jgi:hypothetical protein